MVSYVHLGLSQKKYGYFRWQHARFSLNRRKDFMKAMVRGEGRLNTATGFWER